METKPKRISVACDFCRNKKIKCDGGQPCFNCHQLKSEQCHYSERPRKRRRNHGPEGSMQSLNSRLTRLETLLGSLADRLDPLSADTSTTQPLPQRDVSDASMSAHRVLGKRPPAPKQPKPAQDSDSDSSSLFVDSLSPSFHHGDDDPIDGAGTKGKHQLKTKFNMYLGVHSVLSILLGASLDHLRYFLQPQDYSLLTPLRNLPTLFHLKMSERLVRWYQGASPDAKLKTESLRNPLPLDSEWVTQLVDAYYGQVPLAPYICDTAEVCSLLDKYYKPKSHRLRVLELFIVSAAICLAITCKLSGEGPGAVPSSDSTPLAAPDLAAEVARLESVKNDLRAKCIRYFYRLSICTEGFEAIQAFLLWLIFTELHDLTPFVKMMILSVAIRHGHEQGLHRLETMEELSPALRAKRRRVWTLCLYLDMEVCFSNGKCPISNFGDLSLATASLVEDHTAQSWSFYDTTQDRKYLMLTVPTSSSDYYLTALLAFTKIRARSYSELFASNIHFDDFGTFISQLALINDEMFALASLMGRYGPRFYSSHHSNDDDDIPHCYKVFHLNFFSHLMTINRLPFMVEDVHSSVVDVLRFRNYTLNSARSILKMRSQQRLPHIWLEWSLWYPLTAFLCLGRMCLNRPSSAETLKDIQLLVDSCVSMCMYRKEGSGAYFEHTLELNTFNALFVRLTLRVVVGSVEASTNTLVIDDSTRKYLETTWEICPDLFLEADDFLKVARSKRWDILNVKPLPQVDASSGGQWGSPTSALTLMPMDHLDSGSDYNVMGWDDAFFHSMLPLQMGPEQGLMFDNGL